MTVPSVLDLILEWFEEDMVVERQKATREDTDSKRAQEQHGIYGHVPLKIQLGYVNGEDDTEKVAALQLFASPTKWRQL